MKILLQEVSPILTIYNQKIRELTGEKLSVKVAFKFAVLAKELTDFTQMGQDRREILINNYAERDEQGNYVYTNEEKTMVKIKPDKLYAAQKEIDELDHLETELHSPLITLEDLEPIMDLLTVNDIAILSPIIEK